MDNSERKCFQVRVPGEDISVCVGGWVVTQSCLTLCDPVDCSPPGSSVLGILQARTLELPFPSPGHLLN